MSPVRLRRAEPGDADFLVELRNRTDVEPYLSARASKDRASVLAEIERSRAEPEAHGRFVIELDGERAGTTAFERVNERSRIAHLSGLAVAPGFRGRGVAGEAARLLQRHLIVELGYHRLEMEVYGFNERALRHAERAGWIREGVKRKAYERHGEWVDGVLYGLIEEDLRATPETEES